MSQMYKFGFFVWKEEVMRKSNLDEINEERNRLLRAIEESDIKTIEEIFPRVKQVFKEEKFGIINRVNKDPIRSLKNITLSYNTVYFLIALKAGMDSNVGHYLAEKYAIMIEYTDSEEDLWKIHEQMLANYASYKYRKTYKKELSLVEKIKSYIDKNFMEDISSKTLASTFNISREHMMRTYKREAKDTINNYLIEKRIKEAKQLLLFSDLTITEIALSVGFKNSQYFSNSFKKKTKLTPKDFREMERSH